VDTGFPKRSCSNKKIERDDDSKKSHRAPGKEQCNIKRRGARMMNLQQELDALIESTLAFANNVRERHRIADLPVALRVAEQALADTSKPIQPPVSFAPASERDEIRQRVSNFKAHQQKMAREREDYYLQVKARMLSSVPPVSLPPL
jgi:hypothetical protein